MKKTKHKAIYLCTMQEIYQNPKMALDGWEGKRNILAILFTFMN